MPNAAVLEIEEAAFRAWPAEEVVDLSGWRLRFTHGVTRRANSVWPNGWYGEATLGERLDAVEAFAASRGIAPSYQVTAVARPSELDAVLAARGYSIDAPTIVETLELSQRTPHAEHRGLEVSVATAANADWLTIAVDRARYAGVRNHLLGLLERIGDRAGFGLVRSAEGPIAIGLGVAEGPWLGIFGMVTVPEARRRGAATAILRALAAWGAERGASRAYLQVERENEAARALYASAGFVPAYEYHYRTKFAAR
jgi:GNAT superfamily N-acetyltransferase